MTVEEMVKHLDAISEAFWKLSDSYSHRQRRAVIDPTYFHYLGRAKDAQGNLFSAIVRGTEVSWIVLTSYCENQLRLAAVALGVELSFPTL